MAGSAQRNHWHVGCRDVDEGPSGLPQVKTVACHVAALDDVDKAVAVDVDHRSIDRRILASGPSLRGLVGVTGDDASSFDEPLMVEDHDVHGAVRRPSTCRERDASR